MSQEHQDFEDGVDGQMSRQLESQDQHDCSGNQDPEQPDSQVGSGPVGDDHAGDRDNGKRCVLHVPAEPADDEIIVGAGGKLVVPREEIGDEVDAGDELALEELRRKVLRKPGRREWIAVNLDSELTVNLLIHKPNPDGIETEYFYITPDLRGPIRSELKAIRVFAYYSFTTGRHALWPVHVTPDNAWYESIAPLFKRTPDWFAQNEIRVIPDKPNSRYRIRYRPVQSDVSWPDRDMEELLGEAVGEDHFIRSADHPVYADLIDGKDLDK